MKVKSKLLKKRRPFTFLASFNTKEHFVGNECNLGRCILRFRKESQASIFFFSYVGFTFYAGIFRVTPKPTEYNSRFRVYQMFFFFLCPLLTSPSPARAESLPHHGKLSSASQLERRKSEIPRTPLETALSLIFPLPYLHLNAASISGSIIRIKVHYQPTP